MFSRLPLLEPKTKGVIGALASVVLGSLGGYFFLSSIPAASPQLLQNLALIGASFVIAYVVEAVWLVTRVEGELDEDQEEWLGFLTGAGIVGLLGIAVALLTAEHRAAGHANALDDLGLAFSAVSLIILGSLLVYQPILADLHRSPD